MVVSGIKVPKSSPDRPIPLKQFQEFQKSIQRPTVKKEPSGGIQRAPVRRTRIIVKDTPDGGLEQIGVIKFRGSTTFRDPKTGNIVPKPLGLETEADVQIGKFKETIRGIPSFVKQEVGAIERRKFPKLVARAVTPKVGIPTTKTIPDTKEEVAFASPFAEKLAEIEKLSKKEKEKLAAKIKSGTEPAPEAKLIKVTRKAQADIGKYGRFVAVSEKVRQRAKQRFDTLKNKIQETGILTRKETDKATKKFLKESGRIVIDFATFPVELTDLGFKLINSGVAKLNVNKLSDKDKSAVEKEVMLMKREMRKAAKDVVKQQGTEIKKAVKGDPEAAARVLATVVTVFLAARGVKSSVDKIKAARAAEQKLKKGQTTLKDVFKKIEKEQAKGRPKLEKVKQEKIRKIPATKKPSVIRDTINKAAKQASRLIDEGISLEAVGKALLKKAKAKVPKVRWELPNGKKTFSRKKAESAWLKTLDVKKGVSKKKAQKFIDEFKRNLREREFELNKKLEAELKAAKSKAKKARTVKKEKKLKASEKKKFDASMKQFSVLISQVKLATKDGGLARARVKIIEKIMDTFRSDVKKGLPVEDAELLAKNSLENAFKKGPKIEPDTKKKIDKKKTEKLDEEPIVEGPEGTVQVLEKPKTKTTQVTEKPQVGTKIKEKKPKREGETRFDKSKVGEELKIIEKQIVKAERGALLLRKIQQELKSKSKQNIKDSQALKDEIAQDFKPDVKAIDKISQKVTEDLAQNQKIRQVTLNQIKSLVTKKVTKKVNVLEPINDIFKELPPISKLLKKKLIQEIKKIRKKKKKTFVLSYTPTLSGVGVRARVTTGPFTGFEVRGNVVTLKPVKVVKHKRKDLKNKRFVRSHRRRMPRR